ncbi:MAG: phosphoribosylaminoimidazolecarboxamide formyltransferase / cyclohydrolase [Thermomicrobiales bacterium]|nr:phosphoribosylaminoimidazolecarboxamide formyltransferase / cyclohydrolase [Thermomicrobiales bacterium]
MRALLSVYDKTGIVEFARKLIGAGWEIVSTGGTLSALRAAGIPALAVAEVTGFPEILDGRVKTLHPKIHGGLLARRDLPDHVSALDAHEIVPIDLLAVNLYPFEETVRDPGSAEIDAVEQIDIGGPAMLRAAAKNFAGVIVLTDPEDYGAVADEIEAGTVAPERRRALAAKAFAHVSAYDALVAAYLRADQQSGAEWPHEISFAGRQVQTLRYGENPQQRGAAYRRLTVGPSPTGVLDAQQLSGKELSFNNLLDADAAWGAIRGLNDPAAAIVKHTIPCGLATRPELVDAFALALAGDPVSAFGGIVALNRVVDDETATRLAETFFEVIIAPGFDEHALARLSHKKQLRLLVMPDADENLDVGTGVPDVRPIRGGFLIQDGDDQPTDVAAWRTVTKRSATESECADLRFAWEAVRHVKSNAIVLVKDRAIIGVGSGQPNRIESVMIAVKKAGERATGAVLASDAFFPFADGLEAALAAGVTAAVQPGGSVRDDEVIAAADRAEAAMLFTSVRHFRH